MAKRQSWRKAYGALKDSTTVSLANLNSDFRKLDVAIVKATNHDECPPKEKHIRKILAASGIMRPREDLTYCIRALGRRLAKTHNWTVALKTLIVIHRYLREGDPIFREELINFWQKEDILQLSNFKDDSSSIAWNCSAWVRTYALFLEERLECFLLLKYDNETEVSEKGHSRTRGLNCKELLEQLPALQKLLHRLLGCRPDEAAINNYVIQCALALVLKESFKIYCAINDGIINFVDKFFEMQRHEALNALVIYKRASQQVASLSEFYEVCRGLELARNFQFPNLRGPPQTFLATMEEYIREAPQVVSIPSAPLDFPERFLLTCKQPEEAPTVVENEKPPLEDAKPEPTEITSGPLQKEDTGDLLGLNEFNPGASAIEGSKALAPAIAPSDTSTNSGAVQENSFDPSGWELGLGATNSSAVESQLGHWFDKLTLDSMYDEAAYIQQQHQQQQYYDVFAPNPFMAADPFAASNEITAPPSTQVAAMVQQRSLMTHSNSSMKPMRIQQQHPIFAGTSGFGTFPADNTHVQSNPFSASFC